MRSPKMEHSESTPDLVFILMHRHIDEELQHGMDDKIIGYFSSAQRAAEAQVLVSKASGFRDHLDGFTTVPIQTNQLLWPEGIVVHG